MVIRKGTIDDIDAVSALYDEVCDYLESHTNYPGWRKGIYPDRQDAERWIGEESLFVAESEGEIAGTFILRHEPEAGYALADWKKELLDSEIFVVYTLAVGLWFSHRGIGEGMMRYILSYAAGQGMKAVRLDVYEKNIPAIRLYEKLGFRHVDTVDLGYSQYGLDRFRLYQYLL